MTINPRLLALAAKLDAANECARRLEARQNEDDDLHRARRQRTTVRRSLC